MKKVIFVDDEPNILQGLGRMLRSLRHEYEMFFAAGGKEALEIMQGQQFDVVVADMRMPGMDGAELLNIIQKKHPQAIRIMLSGQADEISILRTVGVVHQSLAKPCDPEKLKRILLQASALQDMLTGGGLKNLILQLGKLPSLPSIYSRLQMAIATPDVGIDEVAEIIAQDIAMTAKILQLVNSSFFGVYTQVNTPARAVTLLGLDIIKALVLNLELFSQIKVSDKVFQIDKLWEHSLTVGNLAKAIAASQTDEKDLINNAFLAGILHDLGRLVLVSCLPEQYLRTIDLAAQDNMTMREAEQAVYGAPQSAVGAFLVGLWGFGVPIIEAIGFQNSIDKYPAVNFTPALAVHVANVLYYRFRPEQMLGRPLAINLSVLEQLGLLKELVKWEKICADIMQQEEKTS